MALARELRAQSLCVPESTSDTVASKAEKGRDHVVAHVSLPRSAETQRYICTPEDGDRVAPHWLVCAQSRAADSGDVVNLDTFVVEVAAHNALSTKGAKYKDACKTHTHHQNADTCAVKPRQYQGQPSDREKMPGGLSVKPRRREAVSREGCASSPLAAGRALGGQLESGDFSCVSRHGGVTYVLT